MTTTNENARTDRGAIDPAEVERIAAGLSDAQARHLRTCIQLVDDGYGCGGDNLAVEQLGLVRIVLGSRRGKCHEPTPLGRAVAAALAARGGGR